MHVALDTGGMTMQENVCKQNGCTDIYMYSQINIYTVTQTHNYTAWGCSMTDWACEALLATTKIVMFHSVNKP